MSPKKQDGRAFECHICKKKFRQKSHLTVHMKIHNNIKEHECDICRKLFRHKSSLIEHIRSHTAEKPYSCRICEKKFPNRSNLEKHIRIHTGQKKFKCRICDMKFTVKCSLENHLRTHTGETPFVCEHPGCGKSFKQVGDLGKHKRVHTGEKPYSCTECNKEFIEQGNMLKHIRSVHLKLRPHKCSFCKAAFSMKKNLDDHILRHEDKREFACGECNLRFNVKSDLQKHGKVHDPEYQAIKKSKEERIRKLLHKNGYDFKNEHHVDFSCAQIGTFARIDFVLMLGVGILFLEVDENQHQSVNYTAGCDVARMCKVVESLALGGNTLPIAWIRYNPDSFSVDGVKRKRSTESREKILLEEISSLQFGRPLQIKYLFYDVAEEELCVHMDPDYNEALKCVCEYRI